MGYALVFSGQGMQHPGMLPWLADDDTLTQAAHRLGIRHWRDRLDDADWLSNNRHAQVLLTACALAAWRQMAQHLPPPAWIAGYSVGELAAFGAAGVFDPLTALDLAEQRAAAMDACAQATPGGLLGVTGLPRAQVRALCEAWGVQVAIDNGPMSCVLGGPSDALCAAERDCVARGGHVIRLKVRVASHTRWMASARLAFAHALDSSRLQAPTRPLLAGATAERVIRVEQASVALSSQIEQTVRWSECMEAMHAQGVTAVLEVGPGQSLSKLWNGLHPNVPARSVDDFRHLNGIVQWLHKQL